MDLSYHVEQAEIEIREKGRKISSNEARPALGLNSHDGVLGHPDTAELEYMGEDHDIYHKPNFV
jgi:hypothetical protein